MNEVVHVCDSSAFDNTVGSASLPVIVKFGAKWCVPCKVLDPAFERLSGEFSGKALFLSVDIDQVPELAARYQLMGVPSVFVFLGGRVVKRVSTSVTPRSVKKLIQEATGG